MTLISNGDMNQDSLAQVDSAAGRYAHRGPGGVRGDACFAQLDIFRVINGLNSWAKFSCCSPSLPLDVRAKLADKLARHMASKMLQERPCTSDEMFLESLAVALRQGGGLR